MKRTRRFWTHAEIARLRAFYPDVPTSAIARTMQRQVDAVHSKARDLGIHKTAAYLASPAACRLRRGNGPDHPGFATQFKKGQIPWSAGKKGIRMSKATEFKRGHMPHNHLPVGSVVPTTDGYLKKKLAEPKTWEFVHILTWQEHHGSVPKGKLIRFKSGNKLNCDIANLECVTRAQHCVRNSIHRYPPELRRVFRVAGKLRRTIERREDEEQYRRST